MSASPRGRAPAAGPSGRSPRLRQALRAGVVLLLVSLLLPGEVGLAPEAGGERGRTVPAGEEGAGRGGGRQAAAGGRPRLAAPVRAVDDSVTGRGWAAFEYAGEWRAERGTRAAEDTEHWSPRGGSRYALRFVGAGIALYGTKDRHHGIAAVRVDGGPETLVDLYAPSRREGALLYSRPLLPVGQHRVEVTVTGKRNPKASDTVVTVDRAEVTEALVVVDDTTETGPHFFDYAGDWSVSDGSRKHEGGDHWSADPGSSYRFRFWGSRVQLFGARAPGHGRASVRLDDAEPVEVDLYAAERRDDQVVYASPQLLPGEHVVEVTVTGEQGPARRDQVVAVDRAVVMIGNGPGSGVDVLSSGPGDEAGSESGASPDPGAIEPDWILEPGSAEVEEVDGKLVKEDRGRFHRMISRQRFGGPGKTVTIQLRGRATSIRDRRGSSTVEGAKVGMKWPVPESSSGLEEDDPRSVYGDPDSPNGPGSYIFVTGLTQDGYMELSRNPYGSGDYTFFENESVGYEPGTWKDIVVMVEWLDEPRIRVRYWHNAHGDGKPVYQATDERSPFWDDPGFVWLRTDDADWEYDFIRVRVS